MALVAATLLIPAVAMGGPVADPNHPELSTRLAALATSPATTEAPAQQNTDLGLPGSGAGSLLRSTSGNPVVAIRVSGDPRDRVDAVRNAGGDVLHVSSRYGAIEAAVDPAKLHSVAAVPGVDAVTEELQPMLSGCPQGNSVSEGDAQLLANTARTNFGVTGLGMTVGVLSDSFDRKASAATHASDDVLSGDLPGTTNPCGNTTPVNNLDDTSAGSDEGRGMAQIVHDMAPGAKLAFATAFTGELAFADNIRRLGTAGANVIVDDVTYFDEPFFQDGPVAVAVNDVTASGVTYFSSAGNNNVRSGGNDVASLEAPAFRDAGSCPAGVPAAAGTHCMDFDPGAGVDNTAGYTIPAGQTARFILQWAQPWDGVATDLDMYLMQGSTLITSSTNRNVGGTNTPFEFIGVNNGASAATIQIAVSRYTGAGGGDSGTPRLKIIEANNGGGTVPTEYTTSSGGDVVGPTIFGHNGAGNAVSTAAVPYNNSSTPENYTSRGPATLYYGPVNGSTPAAPLGSPLVLAKPDLAATDCGVTTFFAGAGPPFRFCGTSAAAPHAAGVAALAKELSPTASVSQIKTALAGSGRPVGAFGANAVGSGLIDANAALGSGLPNTIVDATTDAASAVGASSATLNSTINPHGSAATYKYEYGKTTSFGTVIGPFTTGSGGAPVAQPGQAVSGLEANTTYYYRVAARHGTDPQVVGAVNAFTTGGGPSAPAAVTGAASAITSTGATLNGTVNAHGQSTAYTFEYGTDLSFGTITPVTGGLSTGADFAVSATLSGLTAPRTYYYRLVATNATGTTAGPVMSFTTTGPATAPDVTTGAAMAITATGATLPGTINPRGAFTSFTFEYGTDVNFGNITSVQGLLGTPAVTQIVNGSVSGLTPNTFYLYRLVATNAAGTTAGPVMGFTTAP